MLDYLVTDNCSPCSDVHMPDYLGVVAVFPCVHMLDYLVTNHCSPCSHVHMPEYLGSPHWVGGFEDPARCEPRLVQSAGCCFRLVIRTIAGVALVVCVMEQLCHT